MRTKIASSLYQPGLPWLLWLVWTKLKTKKQGACHTQHLTYTISTIRKAEKPGAQQQHRLVAILRNEGPSRPAQVLFCTASRSSSSQSRTTTWTEKKKKKDKHRTAPPQTGIGNYTLGPIIRIKAVPYWVITTYLKEKREKKMNKNDVCFTLGEMCIFTRQLLITLGRRSRSCGFRYLLLSQNIPCCM